MKKRKIEKDMVMFERYGVPNCCKLRCVSKFSLEDIQNYRIDCRSHIGFELNKFIKSKIVRRDYTLNSKCNKYFVNHLQVCQRCFITCYGVSRSILYSNMTPKTLTRFKPCENEIVLFLQDLGKMNQYMPDKNEIHLSYYSKKLVYHYFLQSYDSKSYKKPNEKEISYSYFIRVWKKFLPNIKLRKFMRFAKCSTCTKLKELLSSTLDVNKRSIIKKKLYVHAIKNLQDRDVYETNKRLAVEFPERYISIGMDGADFQKYGLPYFKEKDKQSDNGYKIPINTIGVRVHGQGDYVFTLPMNLPSDSNSIIHCLHKTLIKLKERYNNIHKNGKKIEWPSVLFVQVI